MKVFTIFIKSFGIFVLSSYTVFADNVAVYQDGILTIPRVDISEKAGFYQNARFKLTSQGTWELLDFWMPGKAVLPNYEQKVEVIQTDSFPIQVFLKVTGFKSVPCLVLGQINQRLVGNRFEVVINLAPDEEQFWSKEGIACFQALEPFEEIIPLAVYGLDAGNYEYTVNGTDIGSFILAKDNRL